MSDTYGVVWSVDQVAEVIVSGVVLVADPQLHEAAIDYWDMSSAAHRAVVDRMRTTGSADLVRALDAVLAAPGDLSAVGVLTEHIARELSSDDRWGDLARQAIRADALGRLAAHTGSALRIDVAPLTADDLLTRTRNPAGNRRGAPTSPVVVVVPFRDRTARRSRLRNLLACVEALSDQSVERDSYRIVVVEADTTPRWETVVDPLVDLYVHQRSEGHFNKAWAVNAGVVQAGASELVCVLDGDVLVDRGFVERNVARFACRGAQAHLPFRDALCLDPRSSDVAIRQRVLEGAAAAESDTLRGAILRRPPGHCVWVRSELFHRVGGFDERFVGWGGEDLDFVFRLDVVGAVDRYDDPLLHLHHDRPQTQIDGQRFYAGRQLLTWHPAGPIGQLDGPAASTDDDLAGLIERVEATTP